MFALLSFLILIVMNMIRKVMRTVTWSPRKEQRSWYLSHIKSKQRL